MSSMGEKEERDASTFIHCPPHLLVKACWRGTDCLTLSGSICMYPEVDLVPQCAMCDVAYVTGACVWISENKSSHQGLY